MAIAWPAAIRRHARPSGSTGACAIYGRAARPAHIAGLPRQNPAAVGAIESWDGVACADAAAAQPSGAVEYCDAMAYAKYCRALPLLCISRSPWAVVLRPTLVLGRTRPRPAVLPRCKWE